MFTPSSLCATAAACLALTLPALAQQPLQTLLVGIDRRTVTSLNGDWHYLVDQSPGRALYTSTGAINDKSYAMNDHPHIVGPHNEEYDFSAAPTLKVPGDWNTQVPQLFNYEGVVWYQRDFEAQPKPGPAPSCTSARQTTARTSGSTRSASATTRAATPRSTAKSPRSSIPAATSSSSPSTRRASPTASPPSASTGSTTAASPATSRSSLSPLPSSTTTTYT